MQQLFGALRGNQAETDRFFCLIAGTTPNQEFMAPENIYVHAATLHENSYNRIAATGGSVSVSTESEQSAGQGIFGRRDAAKRRRNGHGCEAQELGARLRQRAERGGKHRRGGRRARTRQSGGHVIDHVLDGRLRAEERLRQTSDARPGLLDVAVELDGHQGVESDLAGERLRSLQRFDGERADPGDEAEDLAGDLGGVTGAECYRCGWAVSDSFSFCPWCGRRILATAIICGYCWKKLGPVVPPAWMEPAVP